MIVVSKSRMVPMTKGSLPALLANSLAGGVLIALLVNGFFGNRTCDYPAGLGGISAPMATVTPKQVPFQVTLEELKEAKSFRFVMGSSAKGLDNYNIIRIDETGACHYIFKDPTLNSWKQAFFQVDPLTVDDLRELLIGLEFFELHRKYEIRLETPELLRFVKVQSDNLKKAVFCENYTPWEIKRLSEFIEARVIGSNAQAIRKAWPVDYEKVKEPVSFDPE